MSDEQREQRNARMWEWYRERIADPEYREQYGDEYRNTLLHPVTGSRRYCAPCAWSALTGVSSNTWPDKPMTDNEEHFALERLRFEHGAPFYIDELPGRLVGIGLRDFREPGRWGLTVKWDDDEEPHAVAVAVHGTECVLADNHIRHPQPLAVVEQHDPYRSAVVAGGFRLVPDEALPVSVRAEGES